MIPEEYVKFETAKLLKEAGFPQWVSPRSEREGVPCIKCYDKTGLLTDWIFKRGDKKSYSAPTQAQAMRWLREEKNINIRINHYEALKKWFFDMLNLVPIDESNNDFDPYAYYDGDNPFAIYGYLESEEYCTTYEAAAEAGIQAACKYLIEKGGNHD